MKTIRFVLPIACLIAACQLGGCGPRNAYRYDAHHLGPARDMVAASIESAGGLDPWRKVGRIHATALITTYDEEFQPYVNRQELTIDLRRGRIASKAKTANGHWRAVVRDSGKYKLDTSGAGTSVVDAKQIISALVRILHRLRGPLNLLGGDEHPTAPTPVRIDGRDLLRVALKTPTKRATAYYFETTSGNMLRMLTDGEGVPGGKGTITCYEEYQMLPNGVTFPKRIKVSTFGRHVLTGRSPVLDVVLSNVRFN